MLTRHVFVYGTLRAGEANDINRLAPAPTSIGRATVRGWMYDFGAYPGLVLDPDGEAIVGEIYAIAPELEPKLDEIEEVYPAARDEYFKREMAVSLLDGGTLDCLVYEINPRYLDGRPAIEGGDWVRFRLARAIS